MDKKGASSKSDKNKNKNKNKNKKIVFWKESPRKNYKHKTKYLNII